MASAPRNDRVVHQDYIVRQRYSNALPPPPGAPKLLDIPTDALNQYTSPAYASRMARNQPLNIEADAFLGMAIDLVGMPGVFEGDESGTIAIHGLFPSALLILILLQQSKLPWSLHQSTLETRTYSVR